MHDLDRTMGRTHLENGFAGFQGEADFEEEYEFEDEADFEEEYESDEVLNEEEVDELASELLEVSNEAELEQFLGGLIKKVGSAAGNFIRRSRQQVEARSNRRQKGPAARRASSRQLRGARDWRPDWRAARERRRSMFGSSRRAQSRRRRVRGTKQFVRLAASDQQRHRCSPAANAREVASHAVTQATHKFAPGLHRIARAPAGPQRRWVRKGRKLVIYGV